MCVYAMYVCMCHVCEAESRTQYNYRLYNHMYLRPDIGIFARERDEGCGSHFPVFMCMYMLQCITKWQKKSRGGDILGSPPLYKTSVHVSLLQV